MSGADRRDGQRCPHSDERQVEPRRVPEAGDPDWSWLDQRPDGATAKAGNANRQTVSAGLRLLRWSTSSPWIDPVLWLAGVMALIELTVFFAGSWHALQDGRGAWALVENPLRVQILEQIAFKAHPVEGAVEAIDDVGWLRRCLDDIRDGDVRSYRYGSGSDGVGPCKRLSIMLSGIGQWDVLGQFDWRGVLPSVFLHAHLLHAAMNLIALLALAPLVAMRFGPGRFLLFFVACGIAGNVLFWLINGLGWAYLPPLGLRLPVIPLVGASGAIFGLVAVEVGLAFRAARARREATTLGLTRRLWRWVFGIVAWHIWFAVTQVPVAWEAHLGGLLMGFALAPLMFRTPSAHRAYLRKVRRRLAGSKAPPVTLP